MMIDREKTMVFVIDDDPSIRSSLESLFRSVGHEVETFASTDAFLASERPDTPGCLVLDVRLPGPSGLEVQRQIAASDAALPIIFLTGYGDVPMSVAAMKAGAVEFLTKPFRDQDMLDAVCRALELGCARRSDARLRDELVSRFETLTQREREVLALVVAGESNKRIAAQLGLSEVTVKVHRASVMRKMDARSLPDLVRFADRLSPLTTKA
jgi:FixJ family two-component response regulator